MVGEAQHILRARIIAIACGYEDADDLDRLRFDPALKLTCGRLPRGPFPENSTWEVESKDLQRQSPDAAAFIPAMGINSPHTARRRVDSRR
jgi:hypothetical protein